MAKKKKSKETKVVLERTYNVPLRKEYMKTAKWKRTKKAVSALRSFLQKHMKSDDVKIGKYLNLEMWKHGIKNPPHHIKVLAKKDEKGVVTAELAEMPAHYQKEIDTEKKKKADKKAKDKKKEDAKKAAEPKKDDKKPVAVTPVPDTTKPEEIKPAIDTTKPEEKKPVEEIPEDSLEAAVGGPDEPEEEKEKKEEEEKKPEQEEIKKREKEELKEIKKEQPPKKPSEPSKEKAAQPKPNAPKNE